MSERARISRLACVTVTLCLLASSASAQTPDPEALFELGRAHRAARRDAEALEVFERLYAATGAPRALAQVALAEAALGRWVAAETHLAEASAAPDAWMTEHGEILDAARERILAHVGDLWVECDAPGAELWIDGQRVAPLPLARALRVVAGTVAVEVRAAGFVTVSRVVMVSPGGVAREPVTLVAVPAPPSVVSVTTPPSVVPPRDDRARVTVGGARRTAAWVTGAGAVGLFVSAGVLYGLGLGEIAAYNDDVTCPGYDAPVQPSACGRRLDTAYTLRTTAIALVAGGGVAAIVSAVLFVATPRSTRARVACGHGPGLVGVTCGLRF